MSDFISNQLQKQTLSPETYSSKILLAKNEVNINFLESKDTGGTFKLHYIVQINTRGRRIDPSKKLSPATIDMQSLRDGIIARIPRYDQDYLTLVSFDDRKAIFELNHEKWIKDATTGMNPRTHFSKFDREFRFKKQIPREIGKVKVSYRFEKFITRKFLDWLENNPNRQSKYFEYLLPKREAAKLRVKFQNMFDWHYDSQWNMVVARLKSVYVIALLYATGTAVKKLSQNNLNKSQKELFSTKVEKNIQKFDRKKWEDFTRRKFF